MEDIESNDKLLQWFERRMEHKVLEKISQKLVHKQDDLFTLVT